MARLMRICGCALSAALLLAGCGGSYYSDSTTTRAAPTIIGGFHVLQVITIHEMEYSLSHPYSLSPSAWQFFSFGYYGIEVVNDGTVAHALALVGHGIEKETGVIAPGASKTFAVNFQRAGRYRLYCPIDGHEAKGMKGTIRIYRHRR